MNHSCGLALVLNQCFRKILAEEFFNSIGRQRTVCIRWATTTRPLFGDETISPQVLQRSVYMDRRETGGVPERTLLPSIQPNCCKPCKDPAMRACESESSGRGHEHANAAHALRLLHPNVWEPICCLFSCQKVLSFSN